MATLLVADKFEGSGLIHGTAPAEKHASIGNWLTEYVATQGQWTRSASGAVLNTTAPTVDFAALYCAPSLAVSNISVFEMEAFGPATLKIFSVSGRTLSLALSAAGVATLSINTGGSVTIATGTARPMALASVFRIEVSDSVLRGYIDNVLWAEVFTSIWSGMTLNKLSLYYYSANGITLPFNGLAIKYVHAQIGVAASGPLGPPSRGYSLPMLIVTGGEYNKGQAEMQLPRLYYPLGPVPPSFWVPSRGCREIP